jgi:hypothetical protein
VEGGEVGESDGEAVGAVEGREVGESDGEAVGALIGAVVSEVVGAPVGTTDRILEGGKVEGDGFKEARGVGEDVGFSVAVNSQIPMKASSLFGCETQPPALTIVRCGRDQDSGQPSRCIKRRIRCGPTPRDHLTL